MLYSRGSLIVESKGRFMIEGTYPNRSLKFQGFKKLYGCKNQDNILKQIHIKSPTL